MMMEQDPKVGEKIVFADQVAVGDLIYFDRPNPGHVLVRRLENWQQASFVGKVYRFGAGLTPGIGRITLVSRDDRPEKIRVHGAGPS